MSLTGWARAAIEGELGDDLTRELLDGGPHRSTWRVRNDRGESLIGKVEHPELRAPLLRARLRIRIRPSRLRREERALRRAVGLGLPVPYPLGVERLDALRDVLWLEDLGPVVPLDETFAPVFGVEAEEDAARLELARAAGDLVRTALRASLSHGDLHLGNLVAHREEPERVHLIDLAKARFAKRPARLAPVDRRSLFLSFPWPDQEPLRAAFAEALGEGPLEPEAPDAVLARFLDARVARCHRSSGPFVVDGIHRWRRIPPETPSETRALPPDLGQQEWEDRFRLEEHGIPVLRALALDAGPGDGQVLLECEAGESMTPSPADPERLARWADRVAAAGRTLDIGAACLLRAPDGSLRVDGLRLDGSDVRRPASPTPEPR